MAQPFLNRRKVFLGAIQTGDTIEILDENAGGVLIKEAATTNLVLVNNDRSDVARDTLSNISNVMGSKAAEITLEGELIASGDVTVPPSIDVILRTCGMERFDTKSFDIGAITDGPFLVGDIVTGATSGATARVAMDTFDGDLVMYVVELTGTLEDAEVIASDAKTVTIASAPVASGFGYKPRSKNMEWGTFSLWEDDYQKTIHSAMGTITFTMEASLIGSFSATITGPITFDEVNPQWGDGTMPTPTFSRELPAVLHSAQLKVSDMDGSNMVTDIIGQTVTFDAANDVQLRRDLNGDTGLKGSHIPKRTPVATIGVEYLKDSQYAVYDRLYDNADSKISFRLGDGTAGKTIVFQGQLNYNEVGVGDENGLSTQSISCSLIDNGAGDNEFSLLFI